LRELDRGGQVFVIHNRVKSIENLKEKLQEIVPEASIVIGHGQMSGRQLESVISEFSHGTYDILLATSIIENGIDMPNVNTLIVDRADWFGMSQLYQIRGRVGRGAQQAYCYFFHAKSNVTEEAQQRLDTLAEHSDLGAGFQVAVRDMEIRGTGDILSTRQSGSISSVGLNLYTQLLQQSVSRLKEVVDMPTVDVTNGTEKKKSAPTINDDKVIIDLPVNAYLPTDWIPEMSLRLQLYRRMGDLQTLNDVDLMERELIDRFGSLPVAVEGLLYQFKVKILGAKLNATAIQKPREHILIKLPWLAAVNRRTLGIILNRNHDDIDVTRTEVQLAFDEDVWQLRLLDVLKMLQTGLPQQVGI
ncbi:MAG: helicase-related protein, partial [Aggregatilineales bacterium]